MSHGQATTFGPGDLVRCNDDRVGCYGLRGTVVDTTDEGLPAPPGGVVVDYGDLAARHGLTSRYYVFQQATDLTPEAEWPAVTVADVPVAEGRVRA